MVSIPQGWLDKDLLDKKLTTRQYIALNILHPPFVLWRSLHFQLDPNV